MPCRRFHLANRKPVNESLVLLKKLWTAFCSPLLLLVHLIEGTVAVRSCYHRRHHDQRSCTQHGQTASFFLLLAVMPSAFAVATRRDGVSDSLLMDTK